MIFERTEKKILKKKGKKKFFLSQIEKFKGNKIFHKTNFKRKIFFEGNKVPEIQSRGNNSQYVQTKHVFR